VSPQSITGIAIKFVGPLDAEEVVLGVGLSSAQQEGSLARSDLEFDWSRALKDSIPGKRFELLGREGDGFDLQGPGKFRVPRG
jgi:hypothetical protein